MPITPRPPSPTIPTVFPPPPAPCTIRGSYIVMAEHMTGPAASIGYESGMMMAKCSCTTIVEV